MRSHPDVTKASVVLRRVIYVLLILALALLLSLSASALSAERPFYQICRSQDHDRSKADERIMACSRVLALVGLAAEVRVEAFLYRSVGYLMKDAYDKALADINEALQLSPNSSEAYVFRGVVHEKMGEKEEAAADYRAALARSKSASSRVFYHASQALKRLSVTH
jgi:Tfp pilus assembly protein PilF